MRCARCKNEWHVSLPTSVDVFSPPPAFQTPEPVPQPQAQPDYQSHAQPPQANTSEPKPAPEAEPEIEVTRDEPQLSPAENFERLKRETAYANLPDIPDFMTKSNLPAVIKKERIWEKLLPLIAVAILFTALAITAVAGRAIVTSVHEEKRPDWDGLVFGDVKSELKYDSGAMKLYVDGVIFNGAEKQKTVPDIRAKALGPDKRVVQSWQVDSPAPEVEPGAKVPFHTEVLAPMEHTIEDVNLEFVVRKAKPNAR